MFDYASKAQTVADKLEEYGQRITLRHRVNGGYAPSTGEVEMDEADVSVFAGVFSYSWQDMRGTSIQAGDVQVLLPGTIAPPLNGDIFIIDGDTYEIVNVKPFAPAGIDNAVLFDCQARRP